MDKFNTEMEFSEKIGSFIGLILGQIIALASLPLWFVFAVISLMIFDSTNSLLDIRRWLIVAPVWVYPLLILIPSIISWKHFSRGNISKAFFWTSIPLTSAMLLFLIYMII